MNLSHTDRRLMEELIRREEAKIHMEHFVPYVTEGIHVPAPHHVILCRALDACLRGQKKRLIVAMPPAHAKSVYSSHNFPAFWLGNRPTDKIIAASHTQPFAAEIGAKVRNLINNELYRRLFEIQISPDTRAKDRWDTTAGGEYYTTGVGGTVVGRRANLILVDDPYKSKQVAYSATERKKISDWFFVDVVPRLLPNGVIVIIATRWHEDDLTGEVLKKSKNGEIEPFELISLPAICEEPELDIEQQLGRTYGEALWPDMYPVNKLEEIRGGMSADGNLDEWNALYQQKPRPAESGEVKADWFPTYVNLPTDEPLLFITSWDTAGTVGERADFTVGLAAALGLTSRNFYLMDMYREQAEFHTLMRDIPRFNAVHHAHAVLIENKGTGMSLIQVMKQTSGQNIIPIAPQKIGDKQWRFELSVPALEARRVHLPRRADWVPRFMEELLTFPNGVHDDIVDAFSQLINHFGARFNTRGLRPLIGA
jgi:predicted phage terminase large subunit-like protein